MLISHTLSYHIVRLESKCINNNAETQYPDVYLGVCYNDDSSSLCKRSYRALLILPGEAPPKIKIGLSKKKGDLLDDGATREKPHKLLL